MGSRAVTVTTTATRLDTIGDTDGVAGQSFIFYNNGAVTVYLGGPDVTVSGATGGIPVPAGSFSPSYNDLPPGETRYGIVASGTAEVRVDEIGV